MLIAMLLAAGLAAPAGQERDLSFDIEQVQAPASTLVDRVWAALELAPNMPILRDEAVDEAARMESEDLIAKASQPWVEVVTAIHDVDRLSLLFQEGIANSLPKGDAADIEAGLSFYDRPLGRQILELELAARRAILDDEIDAAAREAFDRALAQGDARPQHILSLIEDADLVAPNVAGALNASLAFSRGFEMGGGFDMPLTEQQLLASTWAQRGQLEHDTTQWLRAFLMLSYSSLSDAELEAYRTYLLTPGGRAVAQVMSGAFDHVFQRTSFDMGLAAALRARGTDL